jgi:CheY-like chemotaxis protein
MKREGPRPLILVADDEAPIRNLLRALLEIRYDVVVAANGAEALKACEALTRPVDLAILDILMPGMTGWELLANLRAKYPKIGVIFMSGYTPEDALEGSGLATGGKFIQKPFTIHQINFAVEKELSDQASNTAGT